MEIQLQHCTSERYRVISDTILICQQTAESIVPDSSPDIARVVSTGGVASVGESTLSGGVLRVSGMAELRVLYIPEGEALPRCIPVQLPFQWTETMSLQEGAAVIQCAVETMSADARLLNPRKLLVKAEVRIRAVICLPETMSVCSDASQQGGLSLQKLMGTETDHAVCLLREKQFRFSEVLRPSASKPPVDEVLSYGCESVTTDAKLIGKKLVCKGNLRLNVLYRSGSEPCSMIFDLPFSQIIECEADPSEAVTDADAAVCAINCGKKQDGGLEVTVDAILQAIVWAKRDISYLKDMYIPRQALNLTRSQVPLCTMSEWICSHETLRKFCASDGTARTVLAVSCALPPPIQQAGESGIVCTSDAEVTVLYIDEGGELCSALYKAPISSSQPLPEGCSCKCRCRLAGECAAVSVTGGFEIRIEADFQWHIFKESAICSVSDAEADRSDSCALTLPSLTIRRVYAGETLWDLAKGCGSTVADICVANQLTTEQVTPGTVLLIPAHR